MLKQYALQKKDKNKELNELAEIEQKEKLEKFMKMEGKLVQSSAGSSASTSKKTSDKTELPSVCNMNPNNKAKLPSFWIPSLGPESKTKVPMKKPVNSQLYIIYLGRIISSSTI